MPLLLQQAPCIMYYDFRDLSTDKLVSSSADIKFAGLIHVSFMCFSMHLLLSTSLVSCAFPTIQIHSIKWFIKVSPGFFNNLYYIKHQISLKKISASAVDFLKGLKFLGVIG